MMCCVPLLFVICTANVGRFSKNLTPDFLFFVSKRGFRIIKRGVLHNLTILLKKSADIISKSQRCLLQK